MHDGGKWKKFERMESVLSYKKEAPRINPGVSASPI
jgi:hypothetical protein